MNHYYPTPGRGEKCVDEACQTVTYVWSHNPSAFVGVAACVLTLIAWYFAIRPRPETAEEGDE